MNNRRRYSRYKRKYKKARKPLSKLNQVSEVANRALNVAISTKKLCNVEFKHRDTSNTAGTPTNAGYFVLLNGIAEGDTSEQRSGRQIKMVSYQLKSVLSIHASATKTQVRCMLVVDRQANSNIPVLGDILDNGAATVNIVSPRALFNSKRFRILKDSLYILSAVENPVLSQSLYGKMSTETIYDNINATIADIATNSLYLIFITNEPTNTPSVNFFARIRYTDN